MNSLLYSLFCCLLTTSVLANSRFWGFEDARARFFGEIFESPLNLGAADPYTDPVEATLTAFEQRTGKALQPGSLGKAALKVYTHSGTGIATPPSLTRAVINALVRRGFARHQLLILDARDATLRDAGYLPPLSRIYAEGAFFDGVPVVSLNAPSERNPVWFYDSPLPLEFTTPLGQQLLRPQLNLNPEEARRSYLPASLVQSVDFWINLPMLVDNPSIGLNGAIANASLLNVSNNSRFFSSPANAPVAAAEICAIPELLDPWALSIVTLAQYQFIAGPAFNALYTRSEPKLWASADPVILDANAVRLFNEARTANGFAPLPEVLDSIEYALQLNLGYGLLQQTRWISVSP